jgi:hypothetical protein
MLQMLLLGFTIVAAVALTVLLLLRLPPWLRLPALGLEVLLGIAVGPSGLGWVTTDLPIKTLTVMMLVVVLALAGLENGFATPGDDARASGSERGGGR